jgi:hypothetical protein
MAHEELKQPETAVGTFPQTEPTELGQIWELLKSFGTVAKPYIQDFPKNWAEQYALNRPVDGDIPSTLPPMHPIHAGAPDSATRGMTGIPSLSSGGPGFQFTTPEEFPGHPSRVIETTLPMEMYEREKFILPEDIENTITALLTGGRTGKLSVAQITKAHKDLGDLESEIDSLNTEILRLRTTAEAAGDPVPEEVLKKEDELNKLSSVASRLQASLTRSTELFDIFRGDERDKQEAEVARSYGSQEAEVARSYVSPIDMAKLFQGFRQFQSQERLTQQREQERQQALGRQNEIRQQAASLIPQLFPDLPITPDILQSGIDPSLIPVLIQLAQFRFAQQQSAPSILSTRFTQ